MSALALERVCVDRGGRRVLDDVSLAFAPGRLTAVIGPNGAGKSTLLMVAAGLLAPGYGRATLDGEPLARLGRRGLAARRAYLPQAARAEWPISVERVVALGLTPSLPAFGPLPAGLAARVDAALAAHDLPGTPRPARHRALRRRAGAHHAGPRHGGRPAAPDRRRAHRRPRPPAMPWTRRDACAPAPTPAARSWWRSTTWT